MNDIFEIIELVNNKKYKETSLSRMRKNLKSSDKAGRKSKFRIKVLKKKIRSPRNENQKPNKKIERKIRSVSKQHTSKFLLLKVLNNNKIRFRRNLRYDRNRLKLYDFFCKNENILLLFNSL